MANVKFSELTELSAAPAASDIVPIVDVSASQTKKLTFTNLFSYLSGAISSVLTSNLTASRAVVSDSSGKLTQSTTTSTELGYVGGVTSAIQTQLNARPPGPVVNYLYNGNFDVWTKGTSIASSADDSYPVPGWNFLTSTGTYTISQQTPADIPDGSRYVIRIDSLAAGAYGGFVHFLEAEDAIALKNKTLSVSAKAESSTNGTVTIYIALLTWTSTADAVTSDVVSSWAATPTLAANWAYESGPTSLVASTGFQTIEITGVAMDTAGMTNMAVFIWAHNGDASTQHASFSQVQLQIGSTNVAFVPRPVAQEIALARRRFWRYGGNATGGPAISLRAGAAETIKVPISFPTEMRATPTRTVAGTWALTNCTGPDAVNLHNQGFSFSVAASGSGLVVAAPNGTDDYIDFDSEL